ncbi:MAG: LptF/LptG family permease [Cytophagales bacterium]
MVKKLDKLVLKAFIGPFILTFSVVVFILLLQFMLSYLEDLVGKNLGIWVYARLMGFFSINMMPAAFPLAILVSSLITFGNLGEHFELTAIKSVGVSLPRVLLPIFVFVLLVSGLAFYISNNIVPYANLKAFSLLYDVRQKKPAISLKEGSFYYGIPGYAIKISEKDPETGGLKNVIIYNHTSGRGNTEVIFADSGSMKTVMNEKYLQMELFKGRSYSEVFDEKTGQNLSEQFVRNHFDYSKIMFSLESFKLNRTREELFTTNAVMRNVAQLSGDVDSLNKEITTIKQSVKPTIHNLYNYQFRHQPIDSSINTQQLKHKKNQLSIEEKRQLVGLALGNARAVKNYLISFKERAWFMSKERNGYDIERNRKFTQAVACVIMFLIGAPLGSIIKKGGLGLPLLVSVVFFVVYYLFSMIGTQMSKEGAIPVVVGMWMGNFILLPVGLFFLKQARNDSRIFETDAFAIAWDNLLTVLKKIFLKKKSSE